MKHHALRFAPLPSPPPGGPDDMVDSLRGGSMDALSTAYRRHAGAVYTAAYRILGSADDAEDVTHDVFVSLPRLVKSFDGRGSFEGWLRAIAVRSACMRIRRERRWDVVVDRLRALGGESSEPSGNIDVERALSRLSPAHRAVFVLREIEGRSHEEIAETLGITRAASLVRLHRAKRQLISLLGLDRQE